MTASSPEYPDPIKALGHIIRIARRFQPFGPLTRAQGVAYKGLFAGADCDREGSNSMRALG